MAEYQVTLRTAAFFYITVEAEDDVDAEEKAAELVTGICASCSGWGQEFSLELNDEWETEDVSEAVSDGE
jgi:hypothetical protein